MHPKAIEYYSYTKAQAIARIFAELSEDSTSTDEETARDHAQRILKSIYEDSDAGTISAAEADAVYTETANKYIYLLENYHRSDGLKSAIRSEYQRSGGRANLNNFSIIRQKLYNGDINTIEYLMLMQYNENARNGRKDGKQ